MQKVMVLNTSGGFYRRLRHPVDSNSGLLSLHWNSPYMTSYSSFSGVMKRLYSYPGLLSRPSKCLAVRKFAPHCLQGCVCTSCLLVCSLYSCSMCACLLLVNSVSYLFASCLCATRVCHWPRRGDHHPDVVQLVFLYIFLSAFECFWGIGLVGSFWRETGSADVYGLGTTKSPPDSDTGC